MSALVPVLAVISLSVAGGMANETNPLAPTISYPHLWRLCLDSQSVVTADLSHLAGATDRIECERIIWRRQPVKLERSTIEIHMPYPTDLRGRPVDEPFSYPGRYLLFLGRRNVGIYWVKIENGYLPKYCFGEYRLRQIPLPVPEAARLIKEMVALAEKTADGDIEKHWEELLAGLKHDNLSMRLLSLWIIRGNKRFAVKRLLDELLEGRPADWVFLHRSMLQLTHNWSFEGFAGVAALLYDPSMKSKFLKKKESYVAEWRNLRDAIQRGEDFAPEDPVGEVLTYLDTEDDSEAIHKFGMYFGRSHPPGVRLDRPRQLTEEQRSFMRDWLAERRDKPPAEIRREVIIGVFRDLVMRDVKIVKEALIRDGGISELRRRWMWNLMLEYVEMGADVDPATTQSYGDLVSFFEHLGRLLESGEVALEMDERGYERVAFSYNVSSQDILPVF